MKYQETIINENDEIFHLALITKDHVFYCNYEDSDDNSSTILLDKSKLLLSDNYHATNALIQAYENINKKDYEYISKECLYNAVEYNKQQHEQ